MEKINRLIPISGPSISQKEIQYVTDAVKNAWYERANCYNHKFEDAFAEYIEKKYAVSLPSCTSAIHLSLLSLGIGPGDEVIVPEITWIATAAPISYVGATPIFADIDSDSWCLSVDSFERNISEKTKAVIIVDLYGNIPNMDKIYDIAYKHNIFIIEDAAQAIGSEYKEKRAGSLGDIGVFSFHGSKTLTTGEGGMLVTNREDIYKKVLLLRDHGRMSGERMFWNKEVAYKYKMGNMQAALGLAQLERIDELVEKKRSIYTWYQQHLNYIRGIKLNSSTKEVKNTYWMVTVLWDQTFEVTKEVVIARLRERCIDSRPFFYPLSMLPAYSMLVDGKDYSIINPISYIISPYAINLPCGMNITIENVTEISNIFIDIMNEFRRT